MAAASVSLHRCLLSPASTLQNREKRPMLSLWQLSKKKKKKADRSTAGAGGGGGVISVERKKEMGGRGEDLAVLKIGSCGASLMAEIAGGVLRVQRLLSFHYGRSLRWFSTDAGILLETVILNCRFFTLFGAFGSLVGSILCFFEGFVLVVQSYFEYFFALSRRLDQGEILQHILEAIGIFLVGTAMLMFGMGMYTMFVGTREASRRINGWLMIDGSNLFGIFHLQLLPPGMETKSARQAKLRLGEAVVMLLQTEMLEKMKAVSLTTGTDLACFAAAISAAAAAVFLLSQLHRNRTKLKQHETL